MELSHVFKNEPEGHGERLAQREWSRRAFAKQRRSAEEPTSRLTPTKKKRFGTILMECHGEKNQFMGALKKIPGVNLQKENVCVL